MLTFRTDVFVSTVHQRPLRIQMHTAADENSVPILKSINSSSTICLSNNWKGKDKIKNAIVSKNKREKILSFLGLRVV